MNHSIPFYDKFWVQSSLQAMAIIQSFGNLIAVNLSNSSDDL